MQMLYKRQKLSESPSLPFSASHPLLPSSLATRSLTHVKELSIIVPALRNVVSSNDFASATAKFLQFPPFADDIINDAGVIPRSRNRPFL
ncbi:hypothetical protein L484_025584 [Morus notabilis]|uniref:Uncharacterized protein n=1 Tax=Morus notabilis TaxID=981085 RepID=W9R8K1_9ROSA|nr:hypothetical protein L484_025584 [Morus notabilis]